MGKTSIEWTGETWNPIRGCSKISPGCEHCYAAEIAARFSVPGEPYEGLAKRNPTNWTGEVRFIEDKLFEPLRRRAPTTYFVNSMSDLFHEKLDKYAIDYVVAVMAISPQHTFQVLTKRAERMTEYFNDPDLGGRIYRLVTDWLDQGAPGCLGRQWDRVHDLAGRSTGGFGHYDSTFWKLPLPNVWLGVSVEDQQRADERIPHLLETPAAVRFLSCEPLLGPLDIPQWLGIECRHDDAQVEEDTGATVCQRCDEMTLIDWVIVGGESGRNARPMHPDWARSLRDQCQEAAVPFFFKQWGEYRPWEEGDAHKPGGLWMAQHGKSFPKRDSFMQPGFTLLRRIGKKAAGRLLDGSEWNEMPRQPAEALA